MIIGVDGNEANIDKRVGVNQYAYELLWALYNTHEEWSKKHSLIVYLKDKPREDLPKEEKFWKYRILPGSGLWIIRKLMPDLFFSKTRLDVFFTPSHYLPPFSPFPRVCSIMDLGYLEFSGQFRKYDYWQLRLWSAWSIFVAKRVIAISKATKNDIVRHYQFASRKVMFTHLAYDKNKFNEEISKNSVRRVMQKYSIVGDYVLFLSTLKPSKNVVGLLQAWSKIIQEFPKHKLVIVGKKGWLYSSIFSELEKLKITDSVIFTDYVPEEDKPPLTAGAKVFTLPSFWEGFGLDVLNAMACGVIPVVSDKGSLPEVVGDGGILVNPYDTNNIAQGILRVLKFSKLDYNKLARKSIEQANKFSWTRTAQETLKIIESIQ